MTAPTLSKRYGQRTQRKKMAPAFWYTLAALGVALGVAFVLWVQTSSQDKPTARDVGFTLTSVNEVDVTFEVSKNPEDTAVCALKALNPSAAPVGWKEVAIGPYADENGNGISVQTVALRTLGEAHTVTVDSCWIPEQK